MSRNIVQDTKIGGRTGIHSAVGLDELNRARKCLEWNRREIPRSVLVRAVDDALLRQGLPIVNPVSANAALAVIHQCGRCLRDPLRRDVDRSQFRSHWLAAVCGAHNRIDSDHLPMLCAFESLGGGGVTKSSRNSMLS